MKALLTLAGLLALPGIAGATQGATAWGQVVSMRSYGSGSADQPIYFQVSDISSAGQSPGPLCAHSDWGKGDLVYWFVPPDQKGLLSVLLTAYSSGRNVKVTYDNENQLYYGACKVVYLDVQ